jgi:hypothetical protein
MILLHAGSGSREVQLLDGRVPEEAWRVQRRQAVRLLQSRLELDAAKTLTEIPFELRDGTNGFNDEFTLLYYRAPLSRYIALADSLEESTTSRQYRQIAKALEEAGHPIRFIAIDLADGEESALPEGVTTPSLLLMSDAVERALRDSEHLIQGRGPASGVDRLHTAFHGYLLSVAKAAAIPTIGDAGITHVFKALRTQHPGFQDAGPRHGEIDKIVNSMANIVDALNPVRNTASGAHPNPEVLAEPEAMLVVNAVRTLLHYLNSKISKS